MHPRRARAPLSPPPTHTNTPPLSQVHINLSGVGRTCRRLGVDYAAAMTGFDRRGGRSVPRIEGVVVCAEHEARVVEEHLAAERWAGGWAWRPSPAAPQAA
jgi:xeroderma pigmentosum group C-complementing protein